MDRQFFVKSLQNAIFQRNFLGVLSLLLSIVLIIVSSFLFIKNEKVVMIPQVVEKDFWIKPHSNAQISYFLNGGLFSYPGNIQTSILLQNIDSSFLETLKRKVQEAEEILKNDPQVYFSIDIGIDSELDFKDIKLILKEITFENINNLSFEFFRPLD